MNERVKKLWLDALRSDRYRQGKNALRVMEGKKPCDCCLGVLCDLFRIEHPDKAGWDGTTFLVQEGDRDEMCDEVLPPVVKEWAELDDVDPVVERAALSVHNDGDRGVDGKTFAQIADLIEANL